MKRSKLCNRLLSRVLCACMVLSLFPGLPQAALADAGVFSVYDSEELEAALEQGGDIVLMADIPAGNYGEDGTFFVREDTVLDLNGHSISGEYGYIFLVTNNATLTLCGDGVLDLDNNGNYGTSVSIVSGSTLILSDATLEGTLEVGGHCVMTGGKVMEMTDFYAESVTISGGEVTELGGFTDRNLTITGGTFGFDPSQFIPNGPYRTVRNSDETYTVEHLENSDPIPDDAIAVYDGWKLAAALEQGGNVVLVADIPAGNYTGSGTFFVTKDTVLDLNGHSISGEYGYMFLVTDHATLTLCGDGVLDLVNKYDISVSIVEGSTLILSDATLEGILEVNGHCVMTGGKVAVMRDFYAESVSISGGEVTELEGFNAENLTITGGTFGFDPSQFVPNGPYRTVRNSDETYTVEHLENSDPIPDDAIAVYDGWKLAAALEQGGNVVLVADIPAGNYTGSGTFFVTKDTVLDLNGHSISGEYGYMFLVTDHATLTLCGDGVLDLVNKYDISVSIVEGSTLILSDATLEGILEVNGHCVMTGGKVAVMRDFYAESVSISGGEVTELEGFNAENLTITGGTFGFDPSQFVPNGSYKIVHNSNGTYMVLPDQPGCEIHTEETVPGYAATCTAPGLTDGVYCSVCGHTIVQQEEIPAIGHSWQAATCTEPKVCSVCGTTEGDALGHSWQAATCTEPKICSVCGITEGDALGHNWQAATCTEPMVCSVCGTTEGNALGHSWQAATCTEPKICSVCGTTEGDALGHRFDSYVCSVCGSASPDILAVYTADELVTALEQGGDIVLMADIPAGNYTESDAFFVTKDTVLDLNGHSISSEYGYIFLVTNNATLTLCGDGVLDLDNNGNYGTSVSIVSGSTLILFGGTLEGTLEVGGTCVMTGGKVAEMTDFYAESVYISDGEVTELGGFTDRNLTITGGTFGFEPSGFVPNGPYKIVRNSNETYTVEYQDDGHLIPEGAVAVYDGWKLATALKQGGDIALMADIPAGNYTESDAFFVTKDTVLDLNGHSISSEYGYIFLVTNNATLTLCGDGVLDLDNNGNYGTSVSIVSGSTLILFGGTLEGTLEVGGTCVMTGGKVAEMTDFYAESVYISDGEVTELGGFTDRNLTITGGTFGFEPSGFVPNGPYKIVRNSNETYTVEYQDDGHLIPDGAVAVYDGWKLAAALKQGGNIALMEDIPQGEYGAFLVSEDTVLNLNGHTIAGADQVILVSDGNLTLCDSSAPDPQVYSLRAMVRTERCGIVEGRIEVDGGSATITGGTVNQLIVNTGSAIITGGVVNDVITKDGTVAITGGTLGFDPSNAVDPDRYRVVDNGDGTYTVVCNHSGGQATCQNQAVCDHCGESYGELDPDGHISEKAENQANCSNPAVCDLCGSTYGQVREHQFTVTVLEPTCTSAGYIMEDCIFCDYGQGKYLDVLLHSYKDGVCTGCGKIDLELEDPIVKPVVYPTLTLSAPTLEFKDMIKIIAFFTAENTQDVVEMGMLTYTGKVDAVDISTAAYVIRGADYDESGGRYFASSQGIHAKYLGDTVYLACYAKLTNGSYVYTKLAPYSPITYATNQLKNSSDMKLKQLVAAMLNYGAAAQNYFGYNTHIPVNATLTAEQLALPEAYNADMVGAAPVVDAARQGLFANNQGFSVRKPAVSFEGAFSINYWFTPAYTPVDGITLYYWTEADFEAADVLSVDNATGAINMVIDNGQYRADIEGIAAKDLSKAVYVAAVYSDGTTTWTSGVLGYSIGNYCSSMAKGTGAMAELAKATAVYGYHAKAYFG